MSKGLTYRAAAEDELTQLQALWHTAFGDSMACIEGFFTACPSARALVAADDAVRAMLFLLPVTLCLPGGETARGEYLYALATHPDQRGKGHASHLMQYADELLQTEETDYLTVVPARPDLHVFFGGAGFGAYFTMNEVTLQTNRLPAPEHAGGSYPLFPDEYHETRAACLSHIQDMGYLLFSEEASAFQQVLSDLQDGALYGLTVDGHSGCAAVEKRGDGIILIKELLLPPDCMARGAALLSDAMSARQCTVRTPEGLFRPEGTKTVPFGMIKWYASPPETGAVGYFGLGLD
ncbi:MAG: GNAT family N-acetyltransferase [Oscillospiraceae bacterium]|nr:GNAT family N-acetyltransferase [Oscillospiraceae bacterium]